jgi:hypothetical protein
MGHTEVSSESSLALRDSSSGTLSSAVVDSSEMSSTFVCSIFDGELRFLLMKRPKNCKQRVLDRDQSAGRKTQVRIGVRRTISGIEGAEMRRGAAQSWQRGRDAIMPLGNEPTKEE